MALDLLPPNSTKLERAFAAAIDTRVAAIPFDLAALWNPATCPPDLLPWLAWGLSIDRWSSDWSDAEKRAAVQMAIEEQRHKGTRYSVERVLQSYDDLIQLVEWFETTPRMDPRTFEVRLPLIDADGNAGGTRVSAEFARAIVADVIATKPASAHFTLVQELELVGMPAPVVAAQTMLYARLGPSATEADPTVPWGDLLTDQNGEPLTDDLVGFLDGSAP